MSFFTRIHLLISCNNIYKAFNLKERIPFSLRALTLTCLIIVQQILFAFENISPTYFHTFTYQNVDFVRNFFVTNKPLSSWTLFSSLFVFLTVKKCVKKCSTGQWFICTEVTSYKIHTLRPPQLSAIFPSKLHFLLLVRK